MAYRAGFKECQAVRPTEATSYIILSDAECWLWSPKQQQNCTPVPDAVPLGDARSTTSGGDMQSQWGGHPPSTR